MSARETVAQGFEHVAKGPITHCVFHRQRDLMIPDTTDSPRGLVSWEVAKPFLEQDHMRCGVMAWTETQLLIFIPASLDNNYWMKIHAYPRNPSINPLSGADLWMQTID